jgi:hypothetical protein
MNVRTRALFFASLALVVGQISLPGRSTTAASAQAAAPVLEPAQVHHEPHPASDGARSWQPDRPVDRDPAAPFAPSPGSRHPLPAVDVQAVDHPRLASSADALLLLPPSRAPPALS